MKTKSISSKLTILTLSFILLILSNGHFIQGFAAWLFPIALLIGIHKMNPAKKLFTSIIICSTGMQLSFWYFSSSKVNIMFFIPFFMGALMALTFYIQSQIFLKNKTFISTLILPILMTLYEFGIMYLSPNGTFGLLGYSQHEYRAFSQLASVTGVVGLSFVIFWFCAIIYWTFYIDNDVLLKRHVLYTAIGILVLINILGVYRLENPQVEKQVSISTIYHYDLRSQDTSNAFQLYETDLNAFRKWSTDLAKELINLTNIELANGSKIVAHAEVCPNLYEKDLNWYLEEIKSLANEYNAYIITCPYVEYDNGPSENLLHIIDPNGEIVLSHLKYGGNIFEGTLEGNKVINYIDTPYGRLSGIICWDKDFPQVVSQVGEKNIDILFIPSADWYEITPYHSIVGLYRGIENGTNIVSPVINGESMISDVHGQILQRLNHYETDHYIMRGQVPTRGIDTVYNHISHYLVLCDIILLMFVLYKIYSTKKLSLLPNNSLRKEKKKRHRSSDEI